MRNEMDTLERKISTFEIRMYEKDDAGEQSNKQDNFSESKDPALAFYIKEVCSYKLLTHEEEIRLGKEISSGSEDALNRLINSNLRLVIKIARYYATSDYSLLDVIQDGNMGLIKAAKKYDYTKGVKFSTYASWWIKQTIQRNIYVKRRLIRLPHRKEEKFKLIKRYLNEFYRENDRTPTLGELSDVTGISRKEIDTILVSASNVSYLEDNLQKGEDLRLESFIGDDKYVPESILIEKSIKEITGGIIENLIPREREIITKRFGLMGKKKTTLKNTGLSLGISPETVRQIEKKVLEKIKRDFYHAVDFIRV
jgi:RNA polymerase primary sigma factor